MPVDDLPGQGIAKRQLHFIFMMDCSGSMNINGKMEALNHAVREAVPHMKKIAEDNSKAEMLVRCIKFSSGAAWHQSQQTPMNRYDWTTLSSDGGSTDMAGAVKLAGDALSALPAGHYYPPVLCLISDGYPDSVEEFDRRLVELKSNNMGARAIRVAIGIGEEAARPDGKAVLQSFIGNIEVPVLEAHRAQDLVNAIRFVTTVVTSNVTKPPSTPSDGHQTNAIVTPPPPTPSPPNIDLPW